MKHRLLLLMLQKLVSTVSWICADATSAVVALVTKEAVTGSKVYHCSGWTAHAGWCARHADAAVSSSSAAANVHVQWAHVLLVLHISPLRLHVRTRLAWMLVAMMLLRMVLRVRRPYTLNRHWWASKPILGTWTAHSNVTPAVRMPPVLHLLLDSQVFVQRSAVQVWWKEACIWGEWDAWKLLHVVLSLLLLLP